MALEQQQQQKQRFIVLFIFFLTNILFIEGQYYNNDYYSPNYQDVHNNQYNTYNGAYRDYSTYTLNDRRYGQYQPNYYAGGQPGNPRYPGQDERFSYDRVSPISFFFKIN